MSEWNAEAEQRFALTVASELKGIFEQIRAQLGPEVHFGLLIELPIGKDGRLIAMTTDRERIARRAAEWIVSSADPLGAKESE